MSVRHGIQLYFYGAASNKYDGNDRQRGYKSHAVTGIIAKTNNIITTRH